MHADEVATDAELVRALVGAQFPEFAAHDVRALPHAGTDHALYRLGDDLLVRLPRIAWAARQAESDRRVLPLLAPHLPVAVPAPIALGEPGDGYPWRWTIAPWIAGAPPRRADDPHVLAAIADDLAAFTRALHAIDPRGGTVAAPTARGAPLADRDGETSAAIAAGPPEDRDDLTRAWIDLSAAPRYAGPPCWLHGDLKPGNLLAHDGRLAAVIDWGAVALGDPAVDLTPAWMLFDRDTRARFRRATGCDDATWQRGHAWALSISALELPYYASRAPAIAAAAAATLRELLADWRADRATR